MSSLLFRDAALASRRDSWLGEVQIIQPLSIRATSTVCILLISSLALFLVFGMYTRRVHAKGFLAPKTGLITIASPTAGRISIAGAHEGEKVDKGQLLFTVDVDAVSANGQTQEQVLQQLRAQLVSVMHQRKIRQTVAIIEKRALQDELANTVAQVEATRKQIATQEELTKILKDHADQLKDALSKGLALAASYHNQNFLYIQTEVELAGFEQNVIRLDGKKATLQAKLLEFDSNLARDLASFDKQMAEFKQRIAETEAKHAIEVRAPENGILTSLRVHAGQQVPAGGTLLTLLPSVGNLGADLYVESSAIGFVEKGEPVMLRYAAFPFQRFGLHRGEVSEVTRAPIDVDNEPSGPRNPAGGRGLYRIKVTPDQGFVMAYGEKHALEAGMKVEADIALEKRPLYKWLLDPIHHLKRSASLVTEGATP